MNLEPSRDGFRPKVKDTIKVISLGDYVTLNSLNFVQKSDIKSSLLSAVGEGTHHVDEVLEGDGGSLAVLRAVGEDVPLVGRHLFHELGSLEHLHEVVPRDLAEPLGIVL